MAWRESAHINKFRADDIKGADSDLGITGQAASQGGSITIAGGASSKEGNAGGAATVSGSVGSAGSSTTASGAGGAAGVTAGAAGAKADTGAAVGGVGGEANITAGDGGSTASSGANDAGLGGSVAVTAGAGGAASAGTGDGGQGGSVDITPGAGGTSSGGTAGVAGVIRNAGLLVRKQGAPTAMTTSATMTAAGMLGGIITANQGAAGAASYTTLTGTLLDAALPSDFATDDSFDLTIVNISTNAFEDVTVVGGTGVTMVGNVTIASNAAVADQAWGTFRFRKTAANTFSAYRIG